jgi:hypothetical protein
MTPEEKLDRQRNKWRRAKARRRKRARDAEWQRTTNGFIVELEVRRSLRFLEFLVRHGFLANEDAHVQARIEEAPDKLLRSLVVNLLFWDPDEDLGSGGGPSRIRARIDAKVIDNLVTYELIQEEARINLRRTVDKGPRLAREGGSRAGREHPHQGYQAWRAACRHLLSGPQRQSSRLRQTTVKRPTVTAHGGATKYILKEVRGGLSRSLVGA